MSKSLPIAATILVFTGILILLTITDFIETGIQVGRFRFSHWLAWVGIFFIGIYAPVFHILKKQYPNHYRTWLNIHVFGFLTAFLLVSLHVAGQMSRPPQAFPTLGTGIALYITMILLIVTGFLQRFQLVKKSSNWYSPRLNRAFHISLITSFYIITVVHAITNFGTG